MCRERKGRVLTALVGRCRSSYSGYEQRIHVYTMIIVVRHMHYGKRWRRRDARQARQTGIPDDRGRQYLRCVMGGRQWPWARQFKLKTSSPVAFKLAARRPVSITNEDEFEVADIQARTSARRTREWAQGGWRSEEERLADLSCDERRSVDDVVVAG